MGSDFFSVCSAKGAFETCISGLSGCSQGVINTIQGVLEAVNYICTDGKSGIQTCNLSKRTQTQVSSSTTLSKLKDTRILATLEATTAKMSNFWTFWPVIQPIHLILTSRCTPFWKHDWSINRITAQNVQKLLIWAVLASSVASILKVAAESFHSWDTISLFAAELFSHIFQEFSLCHHNI